LTRVKTKRRTWDGAEGLVRGRLKRNRAEAVTERKEKGAEEKTGFFV
jgi:hypothetical protein